MNVEQSLVVSTHGTPKAVGTYGFLDMLRHPSYLFRPPQSSDGRSDVEAVRMGETRKVSCFLRGTIVPFPLRLKQGSLVLSNQGATWEPFWSLNRHPLAIDITVETVSCRPADQREPRVKKGGKILGVIVPAFVVVSCNCPMGVLDLVVPPADEPLVSGFFRRHTGQPT